MSVSEWLTERLQAPSGEHQPSTDVDLFVSVDKLMVLNTNLQVLVHPAAAAAAVMSAFYRATP